MVETAWLQTPLSGSLVETSMLSHAAADWERELQAWTSTEADQTIASKPSQRFGGIYVALMQTDRQTDTHTPHTEIGRAHV